MISIKTKLYSKGKKTTAIILSAMSLISMPCSAYREHINLRIQENQQQENNRVPFGMHINNPNFGALTQRFGRGRAAQMSGNQLGNEFHREFISIINRDLNNFGDNRDDVVIDFIQQLLHYNFENNREFYLINILYLGGMIIVHQFGPAGLKAIINDLNILGNGDINAEGLRLRLMNILHQMQQEQAII